MLERVPTGHRGCPWIVIDRGFLAFAHQHHSTAGIARFLGVGVTTVCNALIEYGIAPSGQNPFPSHDNLPPQPPPDDLFDPQLPVPEILPEELHRIPTQMSSNISEIDDATLDMLILRLQTHYWRARITMIQGMLQRLGHHVQREHVQQALLRVDPVHWVFECIRICRRVYNVPGPNSLWHHDGQHGVYGSAA